MSWHLLDMIVNVILDVGFGTLICIGIYGVCDATVDVLRSARDARTRRLRREQTTPFASTTHVRRVANPYDWTRD